ncbi:MAG: NAD(+) synthase [candidate division Zixibacteria bacterium HGW-Zixibacteria-1]|nr:MAG: NAD(+) synthase [candidate division Zixibacteria bacterium HGW-Zixibacteria-1]
MKFSKNIIKTDPEYEAGLVQDFLAAQVKGIPKRDGIIVGVSGGVDSAVVAALAVRAVGKENVMGMILPEKESNPISAEYALKAINKLGIRHLKVDLTANVASFKAYENRDKVIKEIFPDYGPNHKFNIHLPQNLLDVDRYNYYTLRVDDGKGNVQEKRLTKKQLLAITAAANVKIRSRMIALYYWGEQYNYMVAGTTNKTEFILGDYCKYGDGGTDVECVSHLYKMNIYELAEYLDVPVEIRERTPSPDTFSLPVSDIDFYFCLPFHLLDPLLYAWEYGISAFEAAKVLDLSEEQVKRAFRDFQSKHTSTEHIRVLPGSIERDWIKYTDRKALKPTV